METFRSKKNILYNKLVIGVLITVFVIYNIILYKKGAYINPNKLSEGAVKGQQLWQDNNCAACHQFYGLGGYLGPDLTNIYSDTLKNEAYIRLMINSGINSMPKYNFTETEKDYIIAYLKAIDKTGYFPNKKAKTNKVGWVEIEPKETEDVKK